MPTEPERGLLLLLITGLTSRQTTTLDRGKAPKHKTLNAA